MPIPDSETLFLLVLQLLADDLEHSSQEIRERLKEQAAGFQSNPAIRRAIEEYAMERALNALKDLDYGNFNRTSAYKEYDYTCDKGGKVFFVEVKGTQTKGKTVILTKNEVEHARSSSTTSIIIIVHSVTISVKKKNIQVNGGTRWLRSSGSCSQNTSALFSTLGRSPKRCTARSRVPRTPVLRAGTLTFPSTTVPSPPIVRTPSGRLSDPKTPLSH